MKNALGIDLGGTFIRAGIVDEKGKILNLEKIQTEAKAGKEYIIAKIKDLISKQIALAKEKNQEILGIGIGSPGPLNLEKNEIKEVPNLPGWAGVPIVSILEKSFSYPIKLNNDANCALLAEHWLGNAKNTKNCIGLTLGTGVGGAIIINGKLYSGISGGAGELGHMIISKNGPKCGCGQNGCLESFIGGINFLKKAKEKGDFSSVEDIFQKAQGNDPVAQQSLDYFSHYLGIGLANIINIFNPEKIILGGQIIKSADLFLGKAKRKAQDSCFRTSYDDCEILVAKLGEEAGTIGAAKLLF
jgi:glucokinase